MRVGGATSQLDLPSLAPLSLAGCGRLQLGVPHWGTSVYFGKWLIIDPTFCGSRFSTGRLLAIDDITFYLPGSSGWIIAVGWVRYVIHPLLSRIATPWKL